jgi:hypothetical protein
MNYLFQKKTVYIVDESAVYQEIKNLDYEDFMRFRDDYLNHAVNKEVILDTADARQFHWSRLIKSIEKNMNFIRPISMSDEAIKKRIQRRS